MMFKVNKKGRFLIVAGLLASISSPLLAQSETAPSSSTNAMVNLIRLLVQQGTITQANGDALLRQAEADAGKARSASGELPPAAPGSIRVPYVPETVRNQIRDEIKAEVMKQAQTEGWAAPDKAAPGWVNNVRLSADIRVRSQSDLFSKDNVSGPASIVDYEAINSTSGGFDFNDRNIPTINTTQDRWNRMRLRARLGAEFDVSKFATIGIRLATGDDNGPISTNQILGGGLAKRNIWLDQGFVKLMPTEWVSGTYGRFANPFASTELLFDRDLNFDGVVLEADADSLLSGRLNMAARAGAFPLDFGSSDFPTTRTDKRKYPAKWLFAGQVEGRYDFGGGVKFGAAVGYYHFNNVQGQLSDPCTFSSQEAPLSGGDPEECSTDGTRAFFPRKGNTLFFIRNVVPPDVDPAGILTSYKQFLGLVYKYSVLDLNASVIFPLADFRVALEGNYVRNLAFKRGHECRYGTSVAFQPQTNLSSNGNGEVCSAIGTTKVQSGNEGYLARLTVGVPHPRKWGEWSVSGSYRYLQSDAVLDSLTDSDFHLGGTNAKGYTVAGTLGLFDGVSLTGRWMSANEIAGPRLAIDVFQLDLMAEF